MWLQANFIKASVTCSGPRSPVFGCASVIWPHSQLCSKLRAACQQRLDTGSLAHNQWSKECMWPQLFSKRHEVHSDGNVRSLPILEATPVGEWGTEGLAAINHTPRVNHIKSND